MSGFYCFSILKSQAKQIAKGQGLKHSEALEQVAISANFSSFHDMQKCAVANPREPRLVKAALGVTDLKDALHHDGVSMALELEINQRLSEATQRRRPLREGCVGNPRSRREAARLHISHPYRTG